MMKANYRGSVMRMPDDWTDRNDNYFGQDRGMNLLVKPRLPWPRWRRWLANMLYDLGAWLDGPR